VLEYAVKLGLVLGCDIAKTCRFDRKNYFYPDLPKAYQVSQLFAPICTKGGLEIATEDGGTKFIRLHQIHMEEDAGKLVHQSRYTQLDYNRGCTPLLEIVSEPDFRTADEVIAYLEKLREILMYLDICDCKMQEGSLRADVNLSVRPRGQEKLGTRTEMKNINSFKAIARAIAFESERHIDVLESGGELFQETRRWDDDKGESFAMRSKANATDYRYFPDPDLLPMTVDDAMLERVRLGLPELADKKRERYVNELSITPKIAAILTANAKIAALFDKVAAISNAPTETANLIVGSAILSDEFAPTSDEIETLAAKLATCIKLVLDKQINRNSYKEVVALVFENSKIEPLAYIEEKGLTMVEDTGAAQAAVEQVLRDNPDALADYRAGKQKAFGFLMGQVMKAVGKSASPEVIKSTLMKALEE